MVRWNKDKPLWKLIDDNWYDFGDDGKMYDSCVTNDGYVFEKNGV
ncbi:hypothetical protein B0P06_004300 [Clostridium saccharoperbutylacetonicum]|uniref:Cell wall binding repeat-containing protein n=1 Tax=Clostridium saccharoperbutylacetonicum N1-4(HMT) TaxID=931276 RepID=M1MHK6_9CLOT|nr:hypothetical protein Cspa_c36440 [Clostridium saccharoperbutylacetonicum N1-4(HMT)]NRT61832.1 hypothetical protein [Clostridium saccharoperbutylacetonicum]NSB25158.1 hypothetical protein [Clostridium saccharoperbutylacetonicum]NSB44529.1 hypothetical protein [Clostridium saccharoperbutylacetonicum]